jgi:hypothetical protein
LPFKCNLQRYSVGFAPSPFLKCALAQTDPNDGHGAAAFGTYPPAPALGEYHHYYRAGTSGHMRKLTAPFTFANEPRTVGLCVALHDAHWSAMYREPMTCDFVSSSSNQRSCLWGRPSPWALGRGEVVFGTAAGVADGGVGTSGLPLAQTNDWTGPLDPRHRSQSAALTAAWTANVWTREGKVGLCVALHDAHWPALYV